MTVEDGELVVRANKGEGFHISSAVRDRVLNSGASVLVRDTSVDAAFRGDITTLKGQLPPDQVGASGQLQEWLEDVDGASYGDKGQRHC